LIADFLSNISTKYYSYLLPSVSARSATALLQHGIQLLLPLKIVPPYTVSSATSSLTSWPSSLTINILRLATW